MDRVLNEVIIMLTDRQSLIFQTIIDDFIESAHPVGSRAIANKDHISVSAATIRNVMADLEEMGFLEKIHSSSGRMPSEKGYRYYVDHLLSPATLMDDVNIIEHFLQNGFYEFEQIVQMSAEVLSDLTNYTTIILGPEVLEAKLMQLQMVTLSDYTAVAILITNTGHVEHRSFSTPRKINPSDLEKMVNFLNDHLYGVPIVQLPNTLNKELISLMKQYINDVDEMVDYLKMVFIDEQSSKLYIGGKSNILTQPEFKDVEKVYSFYSLMEKEDELITLLKNAKDGIKVTIGNENEIEAIQNLSLITSSYELGENQMGTIALLGPTRMQYKKVITLLNSLSNEMTGALYKWYDNNE